MAFGIPGTPDIDPDDLNPVKYIPGGEEAGGAVTNPVGFIEDKATQYVIDPVTQQLKPLTEPIKGAIGEYVYDPVSRGYKWVVSSGLPTIVSIKQSLDEFLDNLPIIQQIPQLGFDNLIDKVEDVAGLVDLIKTILETVIRVIGGIARIFSTMTNTFHDIARASPGLATAFETLVNVFIKIFKVGFPLIKDIIQVIIESLPLYLAIGMGVVLYGAIVFFSP